MDAKEFEAVRRLVMASGAEPSYNDLADMSANIEAEVAGSRLLRDVQVERTGDRARMLVARCSAVRSDMRRSRVALELERIWEEALRFRYMEAHVVRWVADTVALSFLTQIEPNGRFLTGALLAELPKGL